MQSPSSAFSYEGNKLQFHPEVSSSLGLAQRGRAQHIPSLLCPLSSLLQLEAVRLQVKLQLCCSATLDKPPGPPEQVQQNNTGGVASTRNIYFPRF